jgi:hypothetical protein
MVGRFGKYGDLKRRKALQRGRSEKIKLERTSVVFLRRRDSRLPCALKSFPGRAAKIYKTAVVAIPPNHLTGKPERAAIKGSKELRINDFFTACPLIWYRLSRLNSNQLGCCEPTSKNGIDQKRNRPG